MRWAVRLAGKAGTVCIIADDGVIATVTEPIFCAAAEAAGKYPIGEHRGVVQITVRNLIIYH